MWVFGVKKLIGVSLTCLTCVLHMQTCVRHRNEITLSDNLFKIEKHSVIQKSRKVWFSARVGHILGMWGCHHTVKPSRRESRGGNLKQLYKNPVCWDITDWLGVLHFIYLRPSSCCQTKYLYQIKGQWFLIYYLFSEKCSINYVKACMKEYYNEIGMRLSE